MAGWTRWVRRTQPWRGLAVDMNIVHECFQHPDKPGLKFVASCQLSSERLVSASCRYEGATVTDDLKAAIFTVLDDDVKAMAAN